jgi:hypothetical protein
MKKKNISNAYIFYKNLLNIKSTSDKDFSNVKLEDI